MRKSLSVCIFLLFLVTAAFAAGVPGTTKVVVYGTTLPAEQLHTLGGERLRSYPEFTVYRLPATAVPALQERAARTGTRVEFPNWDTIGLRRATIDTRTTPDRLVTDAAVDLYIVQFVAPFAA